MKKYSLIFTSLLIITGMGCKKDFLEQSNPNAVTVENAYNTETDITTGVYGVYQALRSGNCVGEGANLWTDNRSDDVNTTDQQSNNGEPFQFSAFSLVPSNSYLLSHWNALYVPISRANIILSIIDKIKFASPAHLSSASSSPQSSCLPPSIASCPYSTTYHPCASSTCG
jgi:hypothetical protein